MIQVRTLSKSFGRFHAVSGVSFDVPRGQVVGLLGTNGAGKTTTLRMITGYLPPDAGTVSVDGKDSMEDSLAARRRIGYLPEAAPAYGEMAVREYLDFRARLQGMRRAARRAAVELGMTRCDLHGVRRRRVGHLSRGYRQRVGLAAAMLHDPPALVLDEPTSALDPQQIRQIRAVIRELARDRAVLVSSHILPEVEQTCDRVVILARGRVVADARPADLAGRGGGETYIIEARPHRSPEELLAALRAVPGAGDVRPERLGDGWWRVAVTPAPGGADLREGLGAAAGAVAAVRELTRDRPSLERAFLAMISGESA